MKRLVFATNNKHKLEEIKSILDGKVEILSLKDIGCSCDIPETAETLEGNSHLKAIFIYDRYGIDCFADDTGLEVEALNGKPGVFSARYAGENNDPEANMKKLLDNMKGVKNRKARFRTVITLIENGEEHQFEGVVNGEILEEKRGEEGFGYDPVFKPENYEYSFAELGETVKNRISHRAKAVQSLCTYLISKNNH